MEIVSVPLPQFGNRCHLLHDGRSAVVVDPPRDPALVEQAAEEAQVDIRAVADTHVHNDYVSGAPLLARRHGADHLVSAAERVAVPHVGVRDGDVLELGQLRLEVLHAPGHTEHHQAFLVGDDRGPSALLSGGSLLRGTVGRTDLVAPERTADLARAQWASVRRLAELPRGTLLLPTHGFGSFCASGAVDDDRDPGTIGEERRVNPALVLDLPVFVSTLLSGYGPVPHYYHHMAELNRAGAGVSPGRAPVPVTAEGVTDAILAGHWVIDVRQRSRFAEGHVAGSLNVEHGHQFATYVGWLVPWQDDIVLLADDPRRLGDAVTELAAIGIEGVGTHLLTPEASLPARHRRVTWDALREVERAVLLDVRRLDEFDSGAVAGALHVPLHELEARRGELPAGEIWVYCRSGFRAGIAASLLQRAGHAVVHVDDDLSRVEELRLPVRGSVAA